MFLCAEAAFVMMALREYANNVRKVSEEVWMYGQQDGSAGDLKEDGMERLAAET